MYAPLILGVPRHLAIYQRVCARLAKQGAKESIDTGLDLKRYAEEHRLPSELSELRHDKVYAVPLSTADQPDAPAVALTGKTQIGWILQLVHTRRWALHCDGKHKLSNDKWLLTTYCSHEVRQNKNSDCKSNAKGIVHSLRPLIYMLGKGIEGIGDVIHGLKAMEFVARTCGQ